MEELFCIGCGAPIQTENKEGLGYTPQSALEKGLETGEVYCQRCFRLRHYNERSIKNGEKRVNRKLQTRFCGGSSL